MNTANETRYDWPSKQAKPPKRTKPPLTSIPVARLKNKLVIIQTPPTPIHTHGFNEKTFSDLPPWAFMYTTVYGLTHIAVYTDGERE